MTSNRDRNAAQDGTEQEIAERASAGAGAGQSRRRDSGRGRSIVSARIGRANNSARNFRAHGPLNPINLGPLSTSERDRSEALYNEPRPVLKLVTIYFFIRRPPPVSPRPPRRLSPGADSRINLRKSVIMLRVASRKAQLSGIKSIAFSFGWSTLAPHPTHNFATTANLATSAGSVTTANLATSAGSVTTANLATSAGSVTTAN
ncbi:hypothetical protein EVAR_26833_1 [Eumeta japonica]|uniref:Uncharacterized protein n=1 Tax=Eumeta variegata TaxID=151549 RepID=A0A4C1VVG3_EUMVA|nr:hypothetical protein EVAR_26833_1 [Eumeta japonica]